VTVAASGLLERARAGDKRATARLLSVVENDEPGAADALRTLYPLTGHAEIVGITGPPVRRLVYSRLISPPVWATPRRSRAARISDIG